MALREVPAAGRPRAPDMILVGPRGVGKTATVSAFAELCAGYEMIGLQAAAGTAGLVDSLLGTARTRIASGAGPWQRAKDAFESITTVTANSPPARRAPLDQGQDRAYWRCGEELESLRRRLERRQH